VLNNPLSYVDPSGYFSLKKVFKSIGRAVQGVINFVKENWRPIVATVVGAVVSIASLGIGSPLGAAITGLGFAGSALLGSMTTAILSGAGAGFGTAFAGSLLSGRSIGDSLVAGLKGGAIGGITAGLTSFASGSLTLLTPLANKILGQSLGPWVAKVGDVMIHSVVDALKSRLQGNAFGSAFLKSLGKNGLSLLSFTYKYMTGESPKLFGFGKNADTTKGDWDLPSKGHLNVGIQGYCAQLCKDPLREGSPLTTFIARYIPFVNAISGAHDYMQVKWTGRSTTWRKILNVPYMIPASLLTIGAYAAERVK